MSRIRTLLEHQRPITSHRRRPLSNLRAGRAGLTHGLGSVRLDALMTHMAIRIERLWNGEPARADETVRLTLERSTAMLTIEIDAIFHGDPPPDAPIGSTDRLWEHEVVELFLLGDDDHYLELEFGPHGHYLAIALHGTRHVATSGATLDFAAVPTNGHWHGRAHVPVRLIPAGLRAFNAYAMHGLAASRRHLAAHPLGGTAPDFHQLQSFASLDCG